MSNDGYIEVPGGRVWYCEEGEGEGLPLLCLHGGPGFTHHSVASMTDLADERRVILFDQLGCGKSDRPGDESMWNTPRYVEEVAAVVEALGLATVRVVRGDPWNFKVTDPPDRDAAEALLLRTGGG